MNEQDFSKKLRPWLERAAGEVGELQATRLKSARLRALEAYREPVRLFGLVTVGAGTAQALRYSVVPQVLLALPLAALLVALVVKSVTPEVDIGELDAQLLTGELPIDAFLDKDFDEWLRTESEA